MLKKIMVAGIRHSCNCIYCFMFLFQISHRETAMPRKIGTAGTVSSTASTSKGSDRRKK